MHPHTAGEPPGPGDPSQHGNPHGGGDRSDDGDRSEPGDTAATFCATLVDEWAALGVQHAVAAPGSRSTPMVLALDAHPAVDLHIAHDERSAAFMALGIAAASGSPAVVLSTSGTAAVHFHAAVVEADLAAVPMLVVTADRPPELQGVLAPQTIDQRELYGSAVRWYCEPGPPAPGGAPWWRDLAADAHARATGVLPGPVHLDLAFREPLLGTPGELPPPRVHDGPAGGRPATGGRHGEGVPWRVTDEDVARLVATLSGRRVLVVAGARAARGDEAGEILDVADALGWPVLADGPSGLRRRHRSVITTFDQLLRHDAFAQEVPEVVLRLGGLLASKVTGAWLAGSGATQLGVDRHGRCPDPDRVLARSFPSVPAELLATLAATGVEPAPAGWRRRWERAERRATGAIESALARMGSGPATEPAVARDVAALAPAGGSVVVSSSMPVRDLEWFAGARDDVTFHSNRGANGIDGVTATAVGVALGSSTPTVLLTGDLAFVHDASSLAALARREVDLAVVVVDNDGGGIFHFLPQAAQLPPETFERVFGTPHGTDIAALAGAFGLPVEEVGSRAGLQAALSGALVRRGPRVVVVRTDRRANVSVHGRLQAAVAAALDG